MFQKNNTKISIKNKKLNNNPIGKEPTTPVESSISLIFNIITTNKNKTEIAPA